MPNSPSLFDELKAAARGFVALLTGDRQASDYFDFSQRGLVGSFIALILATVTTSFGPGLFGVPGEAGDATRSVILGAGLYGIQVGVIYLLLRQLGRSDGFVPYLVADNWISLFIAILTLFMVLTFGANEFAILGIGLVAIVLEVNIARLIVTLAPMQIVMFIIAQLVAQFVGIFLLAAIVPGTGAPPPV
ncbi:hypothetical protein GCM10007989_29790 [Devosia pacifica]|uniref:Yip1 domain-containing protein n=1 Tax=Devosia pacifica TaxID=1335967 RepID=A0A918VXK1_9HYPH|nr:hypothetical protein [Devosia pacifica]GHA31764.1 hypothetical protein GCM10007989_29790 [Devosia pacifica]